MLSLQKLNNDIVKAIPNLIGKGKDTRPIKGEHIMDLYENVYICAKKKSGKTSVIYKILKECATKDTIVIFFVSTINNDDSYKNIRKYLDVKNIQHIDYTSLKSDDGKTDVLNDIIKELEHEAKHGEDDIETPSNTNLIKMNEEQEQETKKNRKSKYRSPQYIFVFDDLSNELHSSSIVSLSKKHRHFLANCIYASQFLHDLDPQTRKQMDRILLFKGQSDKKLEIIHKDADLSVEFDDFLKIYKFATKEPYSFLNIDVRNELFIKNFNTKINIKNKI